MYVFRKKSFRIVFWKLIDVYPLTLKMKELASNTRSTFSAGDFHSDRRRAAVGFFVVVGIIEMLFEIVCR